MKRIGAVVDYGASVMHLPLFEDIKEFPLIFCHPQQLAPTPTMRSNTHLSAFTMLPTMEGLVHIMHAYHPDSPNLHRDTTLFGTLRKASATEIPPAIPAANGGTPLPKMILRQGARAGVSSPPGRHHSLLPIFEAESGERTETLSRVAFADAEIPGTNVHSGRCLGCATIVGNASLIRSEMDSAPHQVARATCLSLSSFRLAVKSECSNRGAVDSHSSHFLLSLCAN